MVFMVNNLGLAVNISLKLYKTKGYTLNIKKKQLFANNIRFVLYKKIAYFCYKII